MSGALGSVVAPEAEAPEADGEDPAPSLGEPDDCGCEDGCEDGCDRGLGGAVRGGWPSGNIATNPGSEFGLIVPRLGLTACTGLRMPNPR